MVPSDVAPPAPGLVVVSRHRVDLDEAKAALAVLARQRGCLNATIARSTDDYDLLVIVTEWDAFRALDLDRVKASLAEPVVVDLRNIYRPAEMARKGFRYVSVGRP